MRSESQDRLNMAYVCAGTSGGVVRVRLCFDYPPPGLGLCRMSWVLLDLRECRVVTDVVSVIRDKFQYSRRTDLELYLQDCYLPPAESALLLRDSDTLRVKVCPPNPKVRKRQREEEEEDDESLKAVSKKNRGAGTSEGMVEPQIRKTLKKRKKKRKKKKLEEPSSSKPRTEQKSRKEKANRTAGAESVEGEESVKKSLKSKNPSSVKTPSNPPKVPQKSSSSSSSSSSSDENEAPVVKRKPPQVPPRPRPQTSTDSSSSSEEDPSKQAQKYIPKPSSVSTTREPTKPPAQTSNGPRASTENHPAPSSLSSSVEVPPKLPAPPCSSSSGPPENGAAPVASVCKNVPNVQQQNGAGDSDGSDIELVIKRPNPQLAVANAPYGWNRGVRGGGRGRGGRERASSWKQDFYHHNYRHEEEHQRETLSNHSVLLQNPPETEVRRDYEVLPLLAAPPAVGTKIAFKLLELTESYTPEVSDYKEGKVVGLNPTTRMIELELLTKSHTPTEPGKFDLVYQNPDGSEHVEYAVTLGSQLTERWESLLEPRLILEQTPS